MGGGSSDETLFTAWCSGSQPAADQLCARYYWRVLRFFELRLEWQAEDLTQRTFLACIERPPASVQTFRTYLFGIARRQLMRSLRDQYTTDRRRRFGEPSPAEHQTRLSALAADREEQRLLLRALTELEPEVQVVLSLYYWENMTARELAETLEIDHPAARSRIVRAREQLKEVLARTSASEAVRSSLLADLEGWARSVMNTAGLSRSDSA